LPSFRVHPELQTDGRSEDWPTWICHEHGVGWYVNSTLIKTKLGKCTYAWDGSSMGKVNFGCGCQQGHTGKDEDCDAKESPYNNKVPPDFTTTSGADSPNVKGCYCMTFPESNRPANGAGSACFWKGVALDTKAGDSEDETHTMLDWRINHTGGPQGGDRGDPMLAWNEMVLDGERMLEALKMDPAGTIPSMVYFGKSGKKAIAQQMAADFQAKYNLAKPVPVIKVNTDLDLEVGQIRYLSMSPTMSSLRD